MERRKVTKIRMQETYTPTADGRGRTRYAGSEYDVPEEVAQEIVEAGVGQFATQSAQEAESKRVDELKEDAKKLGISGYSALNKEQLIAAIENAKKSG